MHTTATQIIKRAGLENDDAKETSHENCSRKSGHLQGSFALESPQRRGRLGPQRKQGGSEEAVPGEGSRAEYSHITAECKEEGEREEVDGWVGVGQGHTQGLHAQSRAQE